MLRGTPRSTRTDAAVPYTTLVRSETVRATGRSGKKPANKVFYCFFKHGGILRLRILHVVEKVQNRPAAVFCNLTQRRAGIGGDGVRHGFHQRNVVDRVAVEK